MSSPESLHLAAPATEEVPPASLVTEVAQVADVSEPPPPRISVDELRQVRRTLEALLEDPSPLLQLDTDERGALMRAAGLLTPTPRTDRQRFVKAQKRAERQAVRDRDRNLIAQTEIRVARKAALFVAPPMLTAGSTEQPQSPPPRGRLETPRNCYVCKQSFDELHFFYDSMCMACAELNYAKRYQSANLKGKVALITGARVKIGYQGALMLLRSGARVIVTTRFPNDAARRYAQEKDFFDWQDRLHIHGLDLRHAPSVELLAKHIEATHDRLDILINNAAQTVRRPPGFYAHLSALEAQHAHSLPEEVRPLLAGHVQCVEALTGVSGGRGRELVPTWRSSDPGLGIHASAALSQVPYALEQQGEVAKLFPTGRLDADEQQVDMRAVNTWRLKLSEVATAEMLEVHLVNAVAPFILCGKLKPLMMRDRSEPGHIVNVSAMEGSFSRGTKTDKHPHTNMAKAALNMMTLTSAQDYARSNIYMNAADTGWVTDEDPFLHAERKQKELHFEPPLDIVDGAARIVDPVFHAINSGHYAWGNFFKDYKPTAW